MTTGRGEINGAGFPGVFSRLPVCEACLSSSMFLFRLGCGTEAGPRGTRETIHACLYARVRARTRTDIPAIILDTRAPGTKVFVARCFSSFFFFLFFLFFLLATDFQSRVRYRLFASRESVRNFAGPLGRTDSIRAGGVRWQRK